ncbi:hypothetical protein, partial [Helicobacter trogontum]
MENKNKELIKKLRDNAELAWSAYGYYDFFTEPFYHMYLLDDNKQAHYIKDIADIMNISYCDVYVADLIFPNREGIKVGTLKGDMTPTQAQRFFEKYDLLDYYPKFDYKHNKQKQGFHACLFQNRESKQYTLAIRGSYDNRDYVKADALNLLIKEQVPRAYYEDMLRFYNQCKAK